MRRKNAIQKGVVDAPTTHFSSCNLELFSHCAILLVGGCCSMQFISADAETFSFRKGFSVFFLSLVKTGLWCQWQHIHLVSWEVRVQIPSAPPGNLSFRSGRVCGEDRSRSFLENPSSLDSSMARFEPVPCAVFHSQHKSKHYLFLGRKAVFQSSEVLSGSRSSSFCWI